MYKFVLKIIFITSVLINDTGLCSSCCIPTVKYYSLRPLSSQHSDLIDDMASGIDGDKTPPIPRRIYLTTSQKSILNQILKRNSNAITQGYLSIDEIAAVYLGGPEEAKKFLKQRVSKGIRSLSEILFVVELYPALFERILIDLDDTLFTTDSYVGSETWFRDEMETYDKTTRNLHAEKYREEKRLLGAGLFRPTEPDLIKRLMDIRKRNPEIKITGLTSRDIQNKEATEEILKRLGVAIDVLYSGSFFGKKTRFLSLLDARKEEIDNENKKRLKKARKKLKTKSQKEPSDELVLEHTKLLEKGIWLYIDDNMPKVIRKKKAESLTGEGVFTYEYTCPQGYGIEQSRRGLIDAVAGQGQAKAISHATDILTLIKSQQDPQARIRLYLDEIVTDGETMRDFVGNSRDERLTMAYIESVSDFLSKGMDESVSAEDRKDLLESYFSLTAPYNKNSWIKAYREGKVSIRMIEEDETRMHLGMSYEIILDAENVYLMLEPFLRYVKQESPDIIVLPDTGARPFKELLEYFIEAENIERENNGIDKLQTKILIFPVSRNVAADTLYELKRWMRLLKGDIRPKNDTERHLIKTLRELNLEILGKDKKAVILDDNVSTGTTAGFIQEILDKEFGTKVTAIFTPFAYKSLDSDSYRQLDVASTFRIYGDYYWRSEDEEVAPPVVIRTAWEYDSGRMRGARSRRRFEYPAGKGVYSRSGKRFREALLDGFKKDYEKNREGLDAGITSFLKSHREPQSQGGPAFYLNDKSCILPDEIAISENLSLKRQKAPHLPPWVIRQEACSRLDAKYISESNVFYFDIVDGRGEVLGYILLVFSSSQEKGIRMVIQKIQPTMEKEAEFEPLHIVEGLKAYIDKDRRHNIKSINMDIDPVTMTGLSESHSVRKKLSEGYWFLPKEEGLLFAYDKIREWTGKTNILWKELNDQEKERLKDAERLLTGIEAAMTDQGAKSAFLRDVLDKGGIENLSRIRKVVEHNLPVSEEDFIFLKVLNGFSSKIDESRIPQRRDTVFLEEARTRLLYANIAERYIVSEQDCRFPSMYFNVKNRTIRNARVRAALEYFLQNIWGNGKDIGRITREELIEWGLMQLYKQFGCNKGRLLEYLAPGCYVLNRQNRYVPNISRPLARANFRRYLAGGWYAVSPGMSYTITGEEIVPEDSGLVKSFFARRKGKKITFADDMNHGMVGYIKDGYGETMDTLYLGPGGVTSLRTEGVEDLGVLDLAKWILGGGEDVTPRDNQKSRIIGKVHWDGSLCIKHDRNLLNTGHLMVGMRYRGRTVIGILKDDLNHGLIVEWYEYDASSDGPKGRLLNISYFTDGSPISLNHSRGMNRDLGWLDFVAWLKNRGKSVVARDNNESQIVRTVDGDGNVWVYQDRSLPKGGYLKVGKKYAGATVVGILREDLNHGVVAEWYEYDEKSHKSRGELLNMNYFYGTRLEYLHVAKAKGRTLGWLDFLKWMRTKGEGVIPRKDDKSRIIREVNDSGGVRISYDASLPNNGNLLVGIRHKGKKVIGILRESLNCGVIVEWYEYDSESDGPKGRVLNVNYFEDGKLRTLNKTGTERTLGWLDFLKWLKTEGEILVNDDSPSKIIGRVGQDGYLRFKSDKTLPKSGLLYVGRKYEGETVIGVLKKDINHGAIVEWFKYDPLRYTQHKEQLNVNYFDGEELKALNYARSKDTLDKLDFIKWQRQKGGGVIPRHNGASMIIRKVNEGGRIYVYRDYKFPHRGYLHVGKSHAGKTVAAILREDINHGFIAEIYEYDDKAKGPTGDLLNINYFEGGALRYLYDIRTKRIRDLGWLDFIKWLKTRGRGVIPRGGNKSRIIGRVNDSGEVTLNRDDSLPAGGCLTVGRDHCGKTVIGILRKDINHGVIVVWYEYDSVNDGPKGPLLNVNYFEGDRPCNINATLAKNRTLGWLDIVKWLKVRGQGVTPRPDRESRVIAPVNQSGRIFIKSDKRLPGRGYILAGQNYTGRTVIGTLRQDINLGVIIELFEYDSDSDGPKGELINIGYFEDGQLKSLNAKITKRRRIAWLDFIKWLKTRGKGVLPRGGNAGRLIEKVQASGHVIIKSDSSLPGGGCLWVGLEHAGKTVIGNLKEDKNHNTTAEWYECDPEHDSPKGDFLIANCFEDDSLISVYNNKSKKTHTLGWLDFLKWLKTIGQGVIPREGGESRIVRKVDNDGLVYIKEGPDLPRRGMMSVGEIHAGKDVIGILKRDLNHGIIAEWYEYDANSDGPKGELLNLHYFDGEKLCVLINQPTKIKRDLGWLDIVRWHRREKIKPREGGQSRVVATVTKNGRVHIKGPLGFQIGKKHKGKDVIGILKRYPSIGVILEWYEYRPQEGPVGKVIKAFGITEGGCIDVTKQLTGLWHGMPGPEAALRSIDKAA